MMAAVLDGQLSIFDFVELPAPPPELFHWCPQCHTCWLERPRSAEVTARNAEGHAIQEDGRCALMHRMGTTEPFYTVAEIKTQVFAAGGKIQYPRPQGFGGFYQCRSQS